MLDALQSFWRRGSRPERVGYIVGVLLLISGLFHFAILVIGGGSWAGPLSLRKASTFGLSFGLTLITIVWVTSFLALGNRTRATLLGAFTAACSVETTLVSMQGWRGVPSHYNVETTFDAWVARLLAAGGVALVAIIISLTIAAFRPSRTPASLRASIQFGFVALLAAQVVGALMIAKGMQLVFAGDPLAAYAAGGTLKPSHAATMHAILAIPAVAWALSFTRWSEDDRLRVVLLAAAGYAMIVAVIAVENVMNPALRQPSMPAVIFAALGTLALLASGGLTVAAIARAPRLEGIRHP